ncbi:MAG TPA: HAD-IB family phosphatase [Gemmatimonadaceae bacterium]|nr:HAD-IB family phosphatase [Gemmatimonadaceae bacterium]
MSRRPAHRAGAGDVPGGRFGTVIFDCDSTLSAIEGITELARAHREEILALTDDAMNGRVPLEEVYGRRLEIIRPCRADLDALAVRYADAALPDARAVVSALHREGVDVRVLSGGLLPAVTAFARQLGIDADHVGAVHVVFDASGAYAGFDRASPLTVSGGKAVIVRHWRATLRAPVMLVGDGITDLEAADEVDLFVAFAGVIERASVAAAARVVVRDRSLAPVLALALGEHPPAHDGDRALYDAGRARLRDAMRDDDADVALGAPPGPPERSPTRSGSS